MTKFSCKPEPGQIEPELTMSKINVSGFAVSTQPVWKSSALGRLRRMKSLGVAVRAVPLNKIKGHTVGYFLRFGYPSNKGHLVLNGNQYS